MATDVIEAQSSAVTVTGISHVIATVAGLDGTNQFYKSVLGLAPADCESWHDCGDNAVFTLPSGQYFILDESPPAEDLDLTARHVAWRVSPAARDRILAAVRAQGGEVFDYCEDRSSERGDNIYFTDPVGNRNQLITRDDAPGDAPAAIDHVAIEVNDAIWAEEFYGRWLDRPVDYRTGWNTQDYIDAKARGVAGMDEAMPGARYWNERYSPFETEKKALRPNPQLYYTMGDATLAVYLAARHYKVPPDGLLRGTPRIGIALAEGSLDAVAGLLESKSVAFEGPIVHERGGPVARSLYARDPGGNFLEFNEAR